MLTKDNYKHAYELMQRNKNCCNATVFDFVVMTDMVSPYLKRPVRTLDRVLEDRVPEDRALEDGAPVPPEAPRPASAGPMGTPVGSNPDLDAGRLDPIGVLVRLLMSGHGAEGGDQTASRLSGRRAA